MKQENREVRYGDPFTELAAAIVLQACQDFKRSCKYLKGLETQMAVTEDLALAEEQQLRSRHACYRNLKRDVERFLLSEWFTTLSDLNGPVLLKRLKEEFE